uniref:No apical meristem-associated C-terminal domain-containing protein n=1 Tax=Hordeum vulgare subsp. vulgare TaxID=112509 RepID=A0A8I7B123_HORVV
MHCYIEFEKYPKWQTHPPPQKKHKKTSDASPGTTSNDEDFDVCTNTLEEEIIPPGTKKDKKERLLKDSACKLSVESVWAQKIYKDDAKETAKNALRESF